MRQCYHQNGQPSTGSCKLFQTLILFFYHFLSLLFHRLLQLSSQFLSFLNLVYIRWCISTVPKDVYGLWLSPSVLNKTQSCRIPQGVTEKPQNTTKPVQLHLPTSCVNFFSSYIYTLLVHQVSLLPFNTRQKTMFLNFLPQNSLFR